MNRLRNRLILVFGFATLAPLLVTAWISVSLLRLSLAPTGELDQVSKSLEKTGRELYQRARESLKTDATLGRVEARTVPSRDARSAGPLPFRSSSPAMKPITLPWLEPMEIGWITWYAMATMCGFTRLRCTASA